MRRLRLASHYIESSRTHDGALRADGRIYPRGVAIDLLTHLPALDALKGDGIRFVAMPTWGRTYYAVAFTGPAGRAAQASGLLVEIERDGRSIVRRRFSPPTADYHRITTRFDTLVDGWPGDGLDGSCLDGTTAAFERIRGSRIVSGIGHCSPHYAQVRGMMLDIVRKFAPGGDLPVDISWMEPESSND